MPGRMGDPDGTEEARKRVRTLKRERIKRIKSWTKITRRSTAGGIDMMRTFGGVDAVPTTRRAYSGGVGQ